MECYVIQFEIFEYVEYVVNWFDLSCDIIFDIKVICVVFDED